MPRQGIHIREVELALDQAPRALLGVVGFANRLAVQRDNPPPHHGIEIGFADSFFFEELLDLRELVALYTEQEAVGRIRRRAAAPGLDQVVARKGQEQHGSKAEREARHLHRVAARMAPQIGYSIPNASVLEEFQQRTIGEKAEKQPGEGKKHQHCSTKSTHHVAAQRKAARLPYQQRCPAERIRNRKAPPAGAASPRGSASPRSRRDGARRSGACRAQSLPRRGPPRGAPSARGSAARARSRRAPPAGRFPDCRLSARVPKKQTSQKYEFFLERRPHRGSTRPGCRSESARSPARRRGSSSSAARC